ncbi:MAG TPA: hypothetical protein VHS76_05835 [Steroidobacteraceae bacterium]|nr:hypothetical protein [Steroidobacteraceae bacterium]
MLLYLWDRTVARRIAIFIAIAMLHFAIGLFLIVHTKTQSTRSIPHGAELVFLPFFEKRELAPKNPPSEKATPAQVRQQPQPVQRRDAPEPNNAITLPNVDWDSEAEAAVARSIDHEALEHRRRNLSGPSEADLEKSRSNAPPARDHHSMGDTERAEGGAVVTWVNDKCFWTTRGIGFDGMPQISKICKDPPKPETELFKDLGNKLDASEARQVP